MDRVAAANVALREWAAKQDRVDPKWGLSHVLMAQVAAGELTAEDMHRLGWTVYGMDALAYGALLVKDKLGVPAPSANA